MKNYPFYPCIIVDFDDTLYNTRQLKKELLEIAKLHNISEELFTKTYQKISQAYTPKKHLEEILKQLTLDSKDKQQNLGIQTNKILKQFEDLFTTQKSAKRLFPFTHDFLKLAKKCTKKLVLLSKGYPKFQHQKVESSKISHFFDQIYYTNDKTEFLKQNLQMQSGLFINDKAEENAEIAKNFKNLKIVQINHFLPSSSNNLNAPSSPNNLKNPENIENAKNLENQSNLHLYDLNQIIDVLKSVQN